MKKHISLLLIVLMIISITACSKETSKTEEELKAEIKAEMEAEMATETEKDSTKNDEEKSNLKILKGTVIDWRSDGVGILLEKPMKFGDETLDHIFSKDWDMILDYVPKKYFHYSEAIDYLAADATIPVEIQVDMDTYERLPSHNDYITVTKVIAMDGVKNPSKTTDQDYTIDYYKDAFYSLVEGTPYIEGVDSTYTNDIKEFGLYHYTGDPRGDLFREAVDKILEAGFFIQQAEGEYMINEEEQMYYDGE